jgi:hypothetical protein
MLSTFFSIVPYMSSGWYYIEKKKPGAIISIAKTAYAGCARFFCSSAAYSAAGFGRRMALNGYPPSINVCWSKVYYIELLYMYTAAAHMCSIGSLLLLFWMDGLFMLIDSNNNIRERVFFSSL